MAFVRPGPPERIFVYGSPGAGKSTAWASLAKKFATSNTPARIHLVDTDNAFYDMIDEVPEAQGVVLPIFVDQGEDGQEWSELVEGIARARKDADPERGDWIVVDRVEPAWEWCQDDFSREAKAVAIEELRAAGRKKVESGQDKNLRAGMTGFEWAEVKSRFRKPFSKLIVSGCNIMVTAGESKISEYTDASGVAKEAFGGLPWRPAGGAGTLLLAHMFRDIIHLRCLNMKQGNYVASAAKARGRKVKLENERVKTFDWTVLVKVCGWRVKSDTED